MIIIIIIIITLFLWNPRPAWRTCRGWLRTAGACCATEISLAAWAGTAPGAPITEAPADEGPLSEALWRGDEISDVASHGLSSDHMFEGPCRWVYRGWLSVAHELRGHCEAV